MKDHFPPRPMTESNQIPDEPTLERRVKTLEKQVDYLEKELASMKQSHSKEASYKSVSSLAARINRITWKDVKKFFKIIIVPLLPAITELINAMTNYKKTKHASRTQHASRAQRAYHPSHVYVTH